MANRTHNKLTEQLKTHHRNLWRILVRNPKFSKEINALRRDYQAWVLGPSIQIGDEEIARSIITPRNYGYGMADDPEQPQPTQDEVQVYSEDNDIREEDQTPISADAWLDDDADVKDDPMKYWEFAGGAMHRWCCLESNWQIELPKDVLESSFPDLNANTVGKWEKFWVPHTKLVPPPVMVDLWPNQTPDADGVLLWVSLDYSKEDLLALIDEVLSQKLRELQLHQAKDPSFIKQRERNTPAKLDRQLLIYDLAERGIPVGEIAEKLDMPLGTVKGSLAAAKRLVAYPTKKRWKARHLQKCEICSVEGRLSEVCENAQAYLSRSQDAFNRTTHNNAPLQYARGPSPGYESDWEDDDRVNDCSSRNEDEEELSACRRDITDPGDEDDDLSYPSF